MLSHCLAVALRSMLIVFICTFIRLENGLTQEVKNGDAIDYKIEVALNIRVPLFKVENNTIPEAVKKLNLVSPVPINAELSAPKSVNISFALQNVKLQEILNEFTQRSNSEWYPGNNAINIIDRTNVSNPQYAMNSVLASFQATEKSKMEVAQELFTRQEILKRRFYVVFVEARRTGVVEKSISLSLSKITPRHVLNAIVAADGQSYWAIYTQEGAHYFSFGKRS
jgi:hypothetical protein